MSKTIDKDNRTLFETMPVGQALARLAVPTVIGQLILLLYNLADTFFIGRTGNPYMVAAASLVFPVYNICVAFANLFGVGGGSLISRLIGMHKEDDAKKVCAYSFYMAMISAAAFSAVVWLLMNPLLTMLGASSDTILFASQYTFYTIVIGAVPTVLTITMGTFLRSVGCAAQAGFGTSMGCLINIALDPLFMFVILPPGNEIIGAAAASMLSNVIRMCYFIYQVTKLQGRTALSISPKCGLPAMNLIGEIFAVGIPSALSMFLYDATNIVIDKLSAAHGDIDLAAIGIVLKAERIPLNTGVGICQAMMPLVAYNYASKNYKRMNDALHKARLSGIIVALISIVMYEVFAGDIMSAFIDEPQTVALGTQFLRVRCLAAVMMFLCFSYVFFFEGLGMGKQSFLLAVLRQLVFNIPLLLILDHCFGMYGIIWTQFIADGCTAVLSHMIYMRVKKRKSLQ